MKFLISCLVLLVSQTAVSNAFCEDGWTNFKGNCYKWFTWIYTDYHKAVELCGTANSQMLTINTKEEQEFITTHYSHIENQIWLDAENSQYENWMNETTKKRKGCAAIRFLSRHEAKWIHTECRYDYDIVCKHAPRDISYLIITLVKELGLDICSRSTTPHSTPLVPSSMPTTVISSSSLTTPSTLPTPAPSSVPTTAPTTTQATTPPPSTTIASTTPSVSTISPKPGNCDSGWSRYGNRCFQSSTGSKMHADAEQDCIHKGGHLASIHSKEENQFVGTLSDPDQYFWLGGMRKDGMTLDKMEWADGSSWDYANWEKDFPTGKGHCLQIYSRNGQWFDYPCDDFAHYCCVKEL